MQRIFTFKSFKSLISLLFILILMCIPIEVNAETLTSGEQRAAVIETARAYHRKGIYVQYDGSRKNLYTPPEDATSQHYIYTVCSGFTFQTYYQTLGIDLPLISDDLIRYAKDNKEKKETVLRYYDSKEELYSEDALGSEEAYLKLHDELCDILLPGDLFIITRSCYDNRKCRQRK